MSSGLDGRRWLRDKVEKGCDLRWLWWEGLPEGEGREAVLVVCDHGRLWEASHLALASQAHWIPSEMLLTGEEWMKTWTVVGRKGFLRG